MEPPPSPFAARPQGEENAKGIPQRRVHRGPADAGGAGGRRRLLRDRRDHPRRRDPAERPGARGPRRQSSGPGLRGDERADPRPGPGQVPGEGDADRRLARHRGPGLRRLRAHDRRRPRHHPGEEPRHQRVPDQPGGPRLPDRVHPDRDLHHRRPEHAGPGPEASHLLRLRPPSRPPGRPDRPPG